MPSDQYPCRACCRSSGEYPDWEPANGEYREEEEPYEFHDYGCQRCEHHQVSSHDEPCASCDYDKKRGHGTRFARTSVSDEQLYEETCAFCLHREASAQEEPCRSCLDSEARQSCTDWDWRKRHGLAGDKAVGKSRLPRGRKLRLRQVTKDDTPCGREVVARAGGSGRLEYLASLAAEYLEEYKPDGVICGCDGAVDTGCIRCSSGWLAGEIRKELRKQEVADGRRAG